MTDRLDDLIEQELAASFARVDARPPLRPRYLERRRARWGWRAAPGLAGLPAALGTKMVVALAAATIAGTGVAAKDVLTGSPNPLSWGPATQQRTPTCAGGSCAIAAPSPPAPGSGPAATDSPAAAGDHGRGPAGDHPGRAGDGATPAVHGAPATSRPADGAGEDHTSSPTASPGADHHAAVATPGHDGSVGGDGSGH